MLVEAESVEASDAAGGNDLAARERAITFDVEDTVVVATRIGDEESELVGGEGEAVRTNEVMGASTSQRPVVVSTR